MEWLTGVWLTLRHSGWFQPSLTGGVFPFPFAWQAWALAGAFVVLLVGTIWLPGDLALFARLALTAGYIGIGMASYD